MAVGADFTGAALNIADFHDASLQSARFVGAKLTDASFAGAALSGADFTRARRPSFPQPPRQPPAVGGPASCARPDLAATAHPHLHHR